MRVSAAIAGALFVALFVALNCSCGEGNSGVYEITPGLATEVPWANGVVPQRNAKDGSLDAKTSPFYPPIGPNTPDPGSGPIDCTRLSEIELSPFSVQTFEPDPTVVNGVGVDETWSSYDDSTYGSFRVPGDASWYPDLFGLFVPTNWGLAADKIAIPVRGGAPGEISSPNCDGKPNNWSFHFRGGRFNYYGGGAEHPLAALEPCPPGSDFCPPAPLPGATTDAVGFPLKAANGKPYAQAPPHQYWDVSHYDGVAFWARRGPDGEGALLAALQDKHTSDALNRENQTFCKRIKTCRTTCLSGLPCTLTDEQVWRCVPPDGKAPLTAPAETEMVYPVCGDSACRSPDYYIDPDFDGTTCKPYDLTGANAGLFCYGDTPPPLPADQCGDGWVAPVLLTLDWTLYVIPFSEFRQVGFAKPAPYLDLHSIYEFALEFPVGSSDVYLDNLSFYRNR